MSEQNGIYKVNEALLFLQKRRIMGFPIIQITRVKGPVLIGSLSIWVSLSHSDGECLCSR